MDVKPERGSTLFRLNRYWEHTRRIRSLSVIFPLFAFLIGLLALAAGSEQTQAQGPAQTLPPVLVAFLGDAGTSGNAQDVLRLIRDKEVDFVLHQGDFAYGNEDAAAARAWNTQVNDILGEGVPYFGSVGNHDNSAWPTYQGLFMDRLSAIEGAECQGDYGVNTACHYKGIFFILSGVGTRGSGHVQFIESQLTQDNSIWSICTWHKNQTAMQVGGKGNEVGWGAYEACREGGAIIATGHEHSYSRTKTLTNMQRRTIDPDSPERNSVQVTEGSTFAFVSGLGGQGIRDQLRCSPTSYPYGCNGEWASIYASNSDPSAKPGALFIEFNYEGDPNKARGQFINVDNAVIDEFMITAVSAGTGGTSPPDSTPPETSVISGPPSVTTDTTGNFSFTSSEAGSSFECQLDSGALTACSSPKSYTGLTGGAHTFQVVATDAAGNPDPTPAIHTWTVDATPPPVGDLITDIAVSNGNTYQKNTLRSGQLTYNDRPYTFTSVPSVLDGQEFIRTANNDKTATNPDFLTFNLTANATVFVLFDDRVGTLPAWLDDGIWSLTGETVGTTDVTRRVYQKQFSGGIVQVGGNAMAPMSGAGSNYNVVAIRNN